MWAVLIFGEMPENFVKSIIAEDHDVFKTCIELGFLKYGASNTVIFEHGLIAKAVLLLLENKPYCEQPTITSIKINKLTAKRILKTCDLSSYSVVKLIISDYIKSLSLLKFTEIMFDISYAAVPDYLLQYGTNLVNVKLILSRYRSVALAYNTNSYMLAAYKTVVYLKYILERHSLSRNETAVVNEQQLILILCEEIIANYSWESSNFTYFFPIFKDIAEVAIKDSMVYKRIIERMPSDKIELFNILAHKSSSIPITAPTLKHGIFNDLDNIVNLLQFSYTW